SRKMRGVNRLDELDKNERSCRALSTFSHVARISLAGVPDGIQRDGIVSLRHMRGRDVLPPSRLSDSLFPPEWHRPPALLRNVGWGDNCPRSCNPLGQTIRRSSQSSDDVHVSPSGQNERV